MLRTTNVPSVASFWVNQIVVLIHTYCYWYRCCYPCNLPLCPKVTRCTESNFTELQKERGAQLQEVISCRGIADLHRQLDWYKISLTSVFTLCFRSLLFKETLNEPASADTHLKTGDIRCCQLILRGSRISWIQPLYK